MKLLLDTRWLTKEPSGVGTYVRQVMLGLFQHPEIETTLFGNSDEKELPKHVKYIPFSGRKKKFFQGLWKTLGFPSIEWLTGKFPLIHYTNATAIPQKQGKYILTIHDLAYIDFPQTIERKNLRFLKANSRNSAIKAAHIITVSDHVKNKVVAEFGISPSKITTIYHGVEKKFFEDVSADERLKVRKRFEIGKKYFLSVSTLEPRKDFITQIKAYRMLPKSVRDEYDLVIAGGNGWKYKKIEREAQRKLKNGAIRLVGYVDNDDLPALMQEASLYLHSSLDEGFGMSPLKALACKLPVIASKTSCHPEILQNHAWYFELGNAENLAETIEKVLGNEDKRKEKAKSGQEHARSFTWGKSSEKTVALYKKISSS